FGSFKYAVYSASTNSKLTLLGSSIWSIARRIQLSHQRHKRRQVRTPFASYRSFFDTLAGLRIGVPRMTKLRRSGLVSLILAGFIQVVNTGFVWSQVTATISGRVEDASGAAVGGATITVKSLETGQTRNVTTDETGNYRIVSVRVGPHEVRVEKPG